MYSIRSGPFLSKRILIPDENIGIDLAKPADVIKIVFSTAIASRRLSLAVCIKTSSWQQRNHKNITIDGILLMIRRRGTLKPFYHYVYSHIFQAFCPHR